MKMRRIYIPVYLVIALAIAGQPYLLGMPAADKNMDQEINNPKKYESYLFIKYLLHLNEFEKVEAVINQYLEKYPHDPFILTEKAFLLSEVKGKFEEALQLLKKSKTIYPDYYYANYLHAFILFTLTDLLKKDDTAGMEKAGEAIKYLEIAIKDNPGFYDAYYLMGVILNSRGEHKKSNDYFEQANQLKQSTAAYIYMASNYRHLNDTDGVINSYKKILAINPSNYRALRALSEIYLEKKDYKIASLYLEKLFQANPNNQKIVQEYLYSLIVSGETEKFMEAANKVDVSDSPLLLYAQAVLLTQEKKYNQAEQLLERLEPKNLNAYLLMAEIHLHQHNYYQAYQTLEGINAEDRDHIYYSLKLHALSLLDMNRQILKLFDLLRDKPLILEKLSADDYYTFLFAIANSNQLEKLREAVQVAKNHIKEKSEPFTHLTRLLQNFSLGKEIDAEPLRFDFNVFLIVTFYKNQQKYERAISLLKKLVQKNQDNQNAYLELCDIYREQERFGEVERLLEKLSRQFPASMTVKNYYAYFLALQNKKLEQALELSAFTLSNDKDNPAYIDTYGYILFRLGRLSEAGKYFEKAYQKCPFDLEIIDHLVDYYRSQKENHHQHIIKIYKKAIDNHVDFEDQLKKRIEKLKNAQ
ncbi:MAG: tetratricopeptide repeat protein [Candidatus Aminicenantes bacterium]|nr:MAG: tetratricopeptide repeat protein [Candidatus Aminicenantes bacterium]